MPGFMPGIHVLAEPKTWMAGTSPAMTLIELIALGRVVAAVDQEVGAGHEARRVARKENRGLCNFLGLAESLQQMLWAGGSPRGLHVAKTLHQTISLDRT